jgi:hypothetical protein
MSTIFIDFIQSQKRIVMKSLFISLILIIAGLQLSGQDKEKERPDHGKTLIGIAAGGSMATNFYNHGTLGGEPPAGLLPMPAGGFTFDFESKRSFSFLIGLYFKGKGDKIDLADYVAGWKFPQNPGSTIRAEASGSVKTSIYWIEFPLALTWNFGRPNRVQFGFGPYAAYGLMGKEKSDFSIKYYLENELLTEETTVEEKDLVLVNFLADSEAAEESRQINRVDYGLYVLLGYKLPPFALTLSSSIGFSNLNPLTGTDLFSTSKSEKVIHSFTPTLTFTYFFKH